MNLRKKQEKLFIQLRKKKLQQRIKIARSNIQMEQKSKLQKSNIEKQWSEVFQQYENECLYYLKERNIEDLCEKLSELNREISEIQDTKTNPSFLLIETKIPSLILYSLTNFQIDSDEKSLMIHLLANVCTANKQQLEKLDLFQVFLLISKLMVNCNPDFFENCIWLYTNLLIEVPDLIEKFYYFDLWKGIFINYNRYQNLDNIMNVFSWFLNVISRNGKLQVPELKVVLTILKQLLDFTDDHEQQIECLESIKNFLLSHSYEDNCQVKIIIEIDFSQTLLDLYEQTLKTEVKKIVTFIFQIFSSYKDVYCQILFSNKNFLSILNRMLYVKQYNILQSSLIIIQNIQKNFVLEAEKVLDVKIAIKLVNIFAQFPHEQLKRNILQIFEWFLHHRNNEFFIELLEYNFHYIFLQNSKGSNKLMLQLQDFLSKFNNINFYDYNRDEYFNFEQYIRAKNEYDEFQNHFEFNQI